MSKLIFLSYFGIAVGLILIIVSIVFVVMANVTRTENKNLINQEIVLTKSKIDQNVIEGSVFKYILDYDTLQEQISLNNIDIENNTKISEICGAIGTTLFLVCEIYIFYKNDILGHRKK